MQTKSILAAAVSVCASIAVATAMGNAQNITPSRASVLRTIPIVRAAGLVGNAGSLDRTFGNGGTVLTQVDPQGHEVAFQQPDGKIVVIATLNDFKIASQVFGTLRYLPNGQLDGTFGIGGVVRTAFSIGSSSSNYGVIQPDGKMVVVGSTSSRNALSQSIDEIALARYDTNGALDRAFGIGGKMTTALLGVSDVANVALVQPDGKIVVGGSAATCFGRNCTNATALVRYAANGLLDETFGHGGKVVVSDAGAIGPINALALERDGSILALSATLLGSTRSPVAHFSATGARQPVAVTGSLLVTAADGNATFLPDGRILVGGGIRGITIHDTDVRVQRFTTQGALDATFGSAPFDFAFPTTPNLNDFVQAIVVTPSGKIVVGGAAATPNFQDDFGLARLQANGALDAGFGNAGLVTTRFTNRDSIGALVLQPDGKIVAVGFSGSGDTSVPNSLALARYIGS